VLAPPTAGSVAEVLTGDEQALAWLSAERQVLVAAVEQAARTGFDRHAWQLAWTLTTTLLRQAVGTSTSRCSRLPWRRLGAWASWARGRDGVQPGPGLRAVWPVSTRVPLSAAGPRAVRPHRCQANQSRACAALTWLAEVRGDLDEALALSQQALDLCRAVGNQIGEGEALNDTGWVQALRGDYPHALASCEKASP